MATTDTSICNICGRTVVGSGSTIGQDANFIGFVTRKDKDTGVNLLAKIVTPNKKRSVLKLVRVKVKANGLDDYSCCVIDHAAMKKIIEDSQDLDAVTESFQFLYNGEHGTNINYTIEKADENSKIEEYLGEDGTIIGRPKYSPTGAADAVGYIRVTVTKNQAEVSSRIMVRIKGMTADEVLNSDKVYNKTSGSLSEFLWNKIKGQNDTYTNGGYKSIASKLEFNNAKNIYVEEISETPITCTWSIDMDEVGEYMKNYASSFPNSNLTMYALPGGSGSRICIDPGNPDYGNIVLPTYQDCVTAFANNQWAELIFTEGNETHDRSLRLGKTDGSTSARLRLRATLTLGDAHPLNVTYLCATTSKCLSNSEVAEFIKSIMQIKINDTAISLISDSAPTAAIEIPVPDMSSSSVSVTPYTISIFGNGHYTNLADSQYDTLRLSRNSLANAVYFKGSPAFYHLNASGACDTTKEYDAASSLFNDSLLKPSEKVDDKPYDDWRISTIGKGVSTSGAKTGFYKADEILDKYADLQSFGIRFRIEIQTMSSEDKDVYVLTFEKAFVLKRLP